MFPGGDQGNWVQQEIPHLQIQCLMVEYLSYCELHCEDWCVIMGLSVWTFTEAANECV